MIFRNCVDAPSALAAVFPKKAVYMATFNVRRFGLQFVGQDKHFRRKKIKKTRRTDEEFSYLRKDVRENLLRVFAKLCCFNAKNNEKIKEMPR